MSEIAPTFTVLYAVGAFITLIIGLSGYAVYRDQPRDLPEVRFQLRCIKYFLVWPVLATRPAMHFVADLAKDLRGTR